MFDTDFRLEVEGPNGHPDLPAVRAGVYGLVGSNQTHNAVLNFSYLMAPASNYMESNKLAKCTLNGWNLSGIAQGVSDTPAGISG